MKGSANSGRACKKGDNVVDLAGQKYQESGEGNEQARKKLVASFNPVLIIANKSALFVPSWSEANVQ